MHVFAWIAAGIVIVSLVYLSFVLTLAEWLAALRKGEAVTLLPERQGRAWPLWTQVALVLLGLVLCAGMFYLLWKPLFPLPSGTAPILGSLGLLLYIAGCACVLWARHALGRMWGISTSRNVKLRDDHQIVRSGPYAFVRNPMYFGWWVAMFGLLLLYPVWMVFLMLIFSVIAFTGRARREDAVLAERFGEAWSEYKRHTKFLIPFLY